MGCVRGQGSVPEEVTLTLGSEKQTRKLAGAREEVPVIVGPTPLWGRWDREEWQESSEVVLRRLGFLPQSRRRDGSEQASDLVRCVSNGSSRPLSGEWVGP